MPHQHFVVYKKHWKKRNKSVWIVLKLKKISPREGDFPIILLRGGIADDL